MEQGGSTHLSEAYRADVIDYLSARYSHDDLSETEFERRVELANEATSVSQLIQIVVDLPQSTALINRITSAAVSREEKGRTDSPDTPRDMQKNAGWVSVRNPEQESRTIMAVFSGSDLTGRWSVPAGLNAVAVFGGTKIDLTEAEIPAGRFYIHAMSVFGGVEIIIPEGVNVESRGFAIFGGFSRPRDAGRYPGGPTLVVDGIAFFGGVEVKDRRSPRRRDRRYLDE